MGKLFLKFYYSSRSRGTKEIRKKWCALKFAWLIYESLYEKFFIKIYGDRKRLHIHACDCILTLLHCLSFRLFCLFTSLFIFWFSSVLCPLANMDLPVCPLFHYQSRKRASTRYISLRWTEIIFLYTHSIMIHAFLPRITKWRNSQFFFPLWSYTFLGFRYDFAFITWSYTFKECGTVHLHSFAQNVLGIDNIQLRFVQCNTFNIIFPKMINIRFLNVYFLVSRFLLLKMNLVFFVSNI